MQCGVGGECLSQHCVVVVVAAAAAGPTTGDFTMKNITLND